MNKKVFIIKFNDNLYNKEFCFKYKKNEEQTGGDNLIGKRNEFLS